MPKNSAAMSAKCRAKGHFLSAKLVIDAGLGLTAQLLVWFGLALPGLQLPLGHALLSAGGDGLQSRAAQRLKVRFYQNQSTTYETCPCSARKSSMTRTRDGTGPPCPT